MNLKFQLPSGRASSKTRKQNVGMFYGLSQVSRYDVKGSKTEANCTLRSLSYNSLFVANLWRRNIHSPSPHARTKDSTKVQSFNGVAEMFLRSVFYKRDGNIKRDETASATSILFFDSVDLTMKKNV